MLAGAHAQQVVASRTKTEMEDLVDFRGRTSHDEIESSITLCCERSPLP